MQQVYNFKNNMIMFYNALEKNGKIEKISIPSFDDLWNEKLLADTIKMCQEYIKESVVVGNNVSWSRLASDVGMEAERRYNVIIFFNKANANNTLMDINKMPDDVVNLSVWMAKNAQDTPDSLIKIKLNVVEDKIDIFTNLGAFCNENWDLNQMYINLSLSANPAEAFKKYGDILHKELDNHFQMNSLKTNCNGCHYSRCIKRTFAQIKYWQDRGWLEDKLERRREYIRQNGENGFFEFKWNYETGLKYVTEEVIEFGQRLLDNNAIYIERWEDNNGRIYIRTKVGCDEIREYDATKPFIAKEVLEKRNFVHLSRTIDGLNKEENTCATYDCQKRGCPVLIAGYMYYLQKEGLLEKRLKEDRAWYNSHVLEANKHIQERHENRLKELKEGDEKNKNRIKKEIEDVGCKISNIDALLESLQNKTQKSMYCMIEAEEGLKQDTIVNIIADALRKSDKIRKSKDRDNDADSLRIPLNALAGSSLVFYTSDTSAYLKPFYYPLTQKKLYIITNISNFIADYKVFKEQKDSYKYRQLAYVLDLISTIKNDTYVIMLGTKEEIEELFEISPKLKYVYQDLHLVIENLTIDDLFEQYKKYLERNVYTILMQRQHDVRKQFDEYIIANRNQMPFKNIDLANYLAMYSNVKNDVVFPPDVYVKKTLDESLKGIIGLDTIKAKVKEFERYTDFNNKAKSMGLEMPPQNLHMVFKGNAGCGKTTIARIIAKMLFDIGVLKENKLVEVDRKDLVAKYIGQTAPKTNEVIQKALGGVLFIDEAYALTQYEGNDFGGEAIATLIKAMEDHKDELVIIFAGYTNEMEKFVEKNPGMASRIGYTFEFPDYTEDELAQMFTYKIKKMGFEIEDTVENEVKAISAYFKKKKSFGNGRFIDKLMQETLMNHSKTCTTDTMKYIFASSLPNVEELTSNKTDKGTVEDSLKDIIGLEPLKEKIKEFEQYIIFTKNAQKANLSIPSRNMHMIFTGNPGSGKTTIARIMAKMLYDIGVLSENKLIEVDRKDLVGQYVGQTAPKTNEVITKALGGVLFIDEAYALTQMKGNDFGAEAIATLVKAMEDKKDEIVVIFAGYKEEMQDFVEQNPGMASRIGYVFDFPDYTEDELYDMYEYKMTKSGFKIDRRAKEQVVELMKYFSDVENIGNGRFVDKVIQETLINHAKNSYEEISLITREDVPDINSMTESLFNGNSMINPEDITEESMRKTAYHEIGHAFVRYKLTNNPNIKKITIRPSGSGTLGRVEYNKSKTYTHSKQDMLNNICGLLAGMAAEEVFIGEFENGNSSDLQKATHIANLIITKFGMSSLGFPVVEDSQTNSLMGKIYEEENKMMKECFEQSKQILSDNRRVVEKLVNYLMRHKELTEEEFLKVIGK